MISGLIPVLSYPGSQESELPVQIPSRFSGQTRRWLQQADIGQCRRALRPEPVIISVWAALTCALALLLWFFNCLDGKGKKDKRRRGAGKNAQSSRPHCNGDAKYAEDLQVQEVLLASLRTSQTVKDPSSSTTQTSLMLNPDLTKIAKEDSDPSQFVCGICFEDREAWQMFSSGSCSHSFCYDCTGKHIMAKIQDNAEVVACPGVGCKAVLDFSACRLMIPKDILVQWDESLCRSLIIGSQTLYCPFADCLAMLVDDSGEVTRKTKCPMCRRLFCALCGVPWHSEFTCKEFQKLNGKEKGKEEGMVEELAKKKKWMKCPHCKYYVEKTEGCVHITCRCGHEFCYRCGSDWRLCKISCSWRL